MELLQQPGFMMSILVVLSASWAVQVLSKPADTMNNMEMGEPTNILSNMGSEGELAPVQGNKHSKLSFEKQCPVCPPCEPQHPRRMGPEYLPPPPPPPKVSKKEELSGEQQMKDKIKKGLKISGYVLTVASLGQPFYMFWGTWSFMHTTKLYTEVNTACTALTSYGWLLYGIIQVSFKDSEEIIGIDAIVMNAISWAVSAFLFAILLLCAREEKGKVCIFVLAWYVGLTLLALHFPIIKWVDKEGPTKVTIGIIAGLFQGFSELIPIANLLYIWWTATPNQEYDQIRHYKKFIIISRAIDSIVTTYWMLYCVFTYQFDAFGVGNIACALLSMVSFVLHSTWAVKPT